MRRLFSLGALVLLGACTKGSLGGSGGSAASTTTTASAGTSTGSSSSAATGATSSGTGGAPPMPLPTGRFHIGMWCGPPAAELTAARFDEIHAAGFTTVSNACDGSTYVPAYDNQMLALAKGRDLDVIVADNRILDALAGMNVGANLDGVVADYGASPELAGYFVGDEPPQSQFAAHASVHQGLITRDPAHYAYTNLLPDYASQAQWGTATYDDYVAQFLSTVKPKVFSFDYYPFLSDGTEAGSFFADMAVIRAHAVATSTPWWQFTQAISYNGHRATNLAEKLWVGTETLAYGGAGVSYFTYWTPPQTSENFGSAIIDINGMETPQYAEAQAINARLAAFGKYLVAAKSTAVFQNGPLSSGQGPRVPGAPIYVPSAAPITVGLFSVGMDDYAFLVNRSYSATTDSDVYVASPQANLEVLDVSSGKFGPMPVKGADAKGTLVHVSISAGDAVLLHLKGPVPMGPPGAEAFVGVVRSDTGTLDVVDSSFGTATLRLAGWNDCPTGYVLGGRDFQSNGFWLCVRSDLAAKTFYVGNVVADAGTLFSVQGGGAATSMGNAGWNTCPAGSTLLGRRFESNGYWVCL